MRAQVEWAPGSANAMSARYRNHIRLCVNEGITVDNPPASDNHKPARSSNRRPNIYTTYIEKTGCLPRPDTAETIGRLLGTRVMAIDGQHYPRPSPDDAHAEGQLRRHKKNYHATAMRTATLKQALECLSAVGEPTSLAVHMKNQSQIGPALDLAVEWLNRFAKEWHNCEQSCYKRAEVSSE